MSENVFCKQKVMLGYSLVNCSRKAETSGYCGTHDPEKVEAKNAARRAIWDERSFRNEIAYALSSSAPDLLKALIDIIGYRNELLKDEENPPTGEDLRDFIFKRWLLWKNAENAITKAQGR